MRTDAEIAPYAGVPVQLYMLQSKMEQQIEFYKTSTDRIVCQIGSFG